MIIRIWILFICISIIDLFIIPTAINAVDVNIISSSVNQDNFEFELKVQIKGAKKATNYLKINTGETWNGSVWYSGGDPKSYLSVQIDSKEIETIVRGRVLSSGEYDFKILRYTQSGNLAQDNSNSLKINFIKKIENTPNATVIPTTAATVIPKIVVTDSPTLMPTVLSETIDQNNIVATNDSIVLDKVSTDTPQIVKIESKKNLLSYFFVFLGVALIIFSAIVLIVKVYNEYYARKE